MTKAEKVGMAREEYNQRQKQENDARNRARVSKEMEVVVEERYIWAQECEKAYVAVKGEGKLWQVNDARMAGYDTPEKRLYLQNKFSRGGEAGRAMRNVARGGAQNHEWTQYYAQRNALKDQHDRAQVLCPKDDLLMAKIYMDTHGKKNQYDDTAAAKFVQQMERARQQAVQEALRLEQSAPKRPLFNVEQERMAEQKRRAELAAKHRRDARLLAVEAAVMNQDAKPDNIVSKSVNAIGSGISQGLEGIASSGLVDNPVVNVGTKALTGGFHVLTGGLFDQAGEDRRWAEARAKERRNRPFGN